MSIPLPRVSQVPPPYTPPVFPDPPVFPPHPYSSIHHTIAGYFRCRVPDDAIALSLAKRFHTTYEQAVAVVAAARAYKEALYPFNGTLLAGKPPSPPKKQGWY